jgi:hypothetical protein
MPSRILPVLCASLLFAGCAPDDLRPFQPSPEYNAFLSRLQTACAGQRIGNATVDNLIESPESTAGINFIDETDRLFAGATAPQDYAVGVSAPIDGWPSDPGVQCILREFERQQSWTTPSTAPPSSAPPNR